MGVVGSKFLTFFGTCTANISTKPHSMVAVFAFAFFKFYTHSTYFGAIAAKGYAAQVVFAKQFYALCGTHFAGCKTGKAGVYHGFIFHNVFIFRFLLLQS
jgi:hypothetical protein